MSTGIGDALRDERERQGRSVDDAARSLRARIGQLEALEAERFEEFGGDVYAKGFLRSYAVELGLDPGPLLSTYNSEVGHDDVPATTLVRGVASPPPPRRNPPAWAAWVLVALLILGGIAFLGTVGPGRSPDSATPEEPLSPPPSPAEVDETDDDAADDDADGEDAEPDPQEPDEAPEPEPEPEPVFEGADVLLALEEQSWMRVTVDGAVVFEQTVPAGETLQFQGEQEVLVRLGNAGGVRVQFNGEDLGAPGGRGEVVTVQFTPEGHEIV